MIERFFRDSAWLYAIEVVVKLKALVILPLLTRRLGTADFGVWSQISVLVALLLPIAVLGTDSAAIRYLPGKDRDRQSAEFSALMAYLIGGATLLAAILYFLRGPLTAAFFGGDERYTDLMPLAALSLLTAVSILGLRTWWRVRNEAKKFGAIAAVQSLFGIVAVVIAILMDGGVTEVVGWTVTGDVILAAMLFVGLWRQGVWSSPDWPALRGFLRFGISVVPAGFAMWGINYADRMFLVRYFGIGEVGVYALAYSLAALLVQSAMGPIWTMYYTAAAALHASKDQASVQRLFERSVEAIFLVTSPILAVLLYFGADLLTVVATPDFARGAIVMPVVGAGYAVLILSSYFETSLGLDNRQVIGTYAAVAALCGNLMLNYALVPSFGMMGAAMATLAACGSQTLATYFFCRRDDLIRVSLRYPLHALVCAAIAWGVAAAAVEHTSSLWLRLIVGSGSGFAGYVVLLYLSKGIPPDFLGWMIRTLNARR